MSLFLLSQFEIIKKKFKIGFNPIKPRLGKKQLLKDELRLYVNKS
jgi:hypothetical protein